MKRDFKLTRIACFYAYVSMASVFSLPPILFVTFKETYGISYTLLGTLVLVNFCTQLLIDLVFTFFSRYFNVRKTVIVMPLLTATGLTLYALTPFLFCGHEFWGLFIATVIFSVASGLAEVLTSPIVAAIPSKNPDRDMSIFHSLYAYGVVGVVIISSLFLHVFGSKNWMWLTLFFAALPIFSSLLFYLAPTPRLDLSGQNTKSRGGKTAMLLCVLLIFFGGAAENSMTNWISSYIEKALNIPKTFGDILGLALFAILLGLGRTLYGKYGKNIYKVLMAGMCAALVCYVLAAVSPFPFLSLFACVFTGFATSLLWPGSLILMEEKFSFSSVAAFALMAAGGDLGGSIGPQLLGIVVDGVANSNFGAFLSATLSVSPEQAGMKVAMLVASLFPIFGIVVLLIIRRKFKKAA